MPVFRTITEEFLLPENVERGEGDEGFGDGDGGPQGHCNYRGVKPMPNPLENDDDVWDLGGVAGLRAHRERKPKEPFIPMPGGGEG